MASCLFFAPFLYLDTQSQSYHMSKYLKYTKSFYFLGLVFFIAWMIFIDSNNVVNQVKLSSKLGQLEDQKEFYIERREKIKAEREELMSNPELLEKFAREKYLMKKNTEDLYVIVKK
ncbi:cell division protein FtsB [Algoriphagus antarcticus]|uniref:Cell division protein FtsB n=2 Tax=Algoriphagus antarcticus TaxID=238540 RepID=A0A3E0DXV5_9BACT|nr:cell division protein FtsB [Algoriphagus antarcticus]